MSERNEAQEAFGELHKAFKNLEERYGLEYFCLAIYPEFRKGISHGEKVRPFISKDRGLVQESLVGYFNMTKAEAEHKLKQALEATPKK